ncbi:MAG: hypothetical protein EPN17_08305 [Methylobacter sp.]|nr:MAG: hypothetical protein EPN17_08305 [Methylobacter sp.]
MPRQLSFQIKNFESYVNGLQRMGIDQGYVLYTNCHASNDKPVARLISADQLDAVQAYIASPSDEAFIRLVKLGALLDTDWDRRTSQWQVISFEGWEALHNAFSRLYTKSEQALVELTGVSDLDSREAPQF